ncbi:MAG: TonB-dependent receptor [Desulfobacterales bacterium]|nr:TonB-dependent receptor [Desulfobacterales bacterium]
MQLFRIIRNLICLLVSFFMVIVLSYAQEIETGLESDTSLDDYLKYVHEEMTVYTASRKEQKIMDAPVSMSVLTHDDIIQSGAIQIPEALNILPGLHFGYTSSNYMLAGGIRGFFKLPANKIVFLIDGLPWAHQVYNIPVFSVMPISLQEIDRIEVLRGPGSSLYGSNAMFGVINVIRSPINKTRGNYFSLTTGEDKTIIGNYMYGGKSDDLLYRVSCEWLQSTNEDYIAWLSDPELKQAKVNSSITYNLPNQSQLNFFGSIIDNKNFDSLNESTGPVDFGKNNYYTAVVEYSSTVPELSIKAFTNGSDKNSGWYFGKKYLFFKENRSGIECQYSGTLLHRNTYVFGFNGAQETVEGKSIGGKHTNNAAGAFIDNTFRASDVVNINGGIRCDRNSNIDPVFSHRLSMQYALTTHNHFRLMWGTSYRKPDFVENFYNSITEKEKGSNIYLHVYGQEDNNPEKASTVELAYICSLTEKLFMETTVFYSKINDFIYFIPIHMNYDPDVAGMMVSLPFMNIGDAEQLGTEYEIKYQFSKNLTALMNYSYVNQKSLDPKNRQLLIMTPKHMANIRLKGNVYQRWSYTLSMHFQSESQWREYAWINTEHGNTHAGGKADSYVVVNLRLGYEMPLSSIMSNATSELFLSVNNLLNHGYDDYPLDTSNIRRRILVGISMHF